MQMPAGTETLATTANHWLAQFEQALGARDDGMLGRLFHRDSHWRDVLALSWRIQTVSGVGALARELKTHAARSRPTGLRTDPARTPPRHVARAGTKCIEAIFRFETAEGHGSGLLRLLPEDKEPRAWTLLTALEELKGHEEQVGSLRPSGQSYSRDFAGPNWLDLRNAASPYDDPDPTYWPALELEGGSYDGAEGGWHAARRRGDGWRRELQPRHVVLGTGVSGIPHIPDIPTLRNFGGTVLHSSQYEDGETTKAKRAIVIGTGNSGHDIAQDLYSSGAKVTLVQRSPTLITQCDPSAQLVYALYSEGPPLEDCDLITASVPFALAKRSHQLATAHARELDRPLLDRLAAKGFRLDYGEDDTGWQFKYLTRGGRSYFNVG